MAKKINSIQKKKIAKILKEQKKNISIDDIEQSVLDTFVINALDIEEVSAVLFAVMHKYLLIDKHKPIVDLTLQQQNKEVLDIDTVMIIQSAFVENFAKKIAKDNK